MSEFLVFDGVWVVSGWCLLITKILGLSWTSVITNVTMDPYVYVTTWLHNRDVNKESDTRRSGTVSLSSGICIGGYCLYMMHRHSVDYHVLLCERGIVW